MTEIERVYEGEVVDENDGWDWEQAVSEWTAGASLELEGQLRQARAAAQVARRYWRSSMEAFAK